MLNLALVEQFLLSSRHQRAGVLSVVSGGLVRRFCFVAGELQMLDLGEDKEQLLLKKCLDYHKIGKEIQQPLLQSPPPGGVVETLRRRQLVSDREFEHLAQVMVEDVLSQVLTSPAESIEFASDQGAETFDLETTAVRLKIQTPVLLKMVENRVRDAAAALQEVGGFDSVFVLAEGSAHAEELDDFQRHLLGFIDGRRSVEDVAIAFRESNAAMAAALAGMSRHGFIRRDPAATARRAGAASAARVAGTARVGTARVAGTARVGTARVASARHVAATHIAGSPSGAAVVLPASSARPTLVSGSAPGRAAVTAPVPPSAVRRYAETTPPGPETPAWQPPVRRFNPYPVIALVVVMGVIGGVWFMIRQDQLMTSALDALELRLDQALVLRRWNEATITSDEAARKAAGTASAQRRADELGRRLREALDREAEVIRGLTSKLDFANARPRATALPAGEAGNRLRADLDRAEAESQRRSESCTAQVRQLLAQGRIVQALAVIDAAAGREGEAAASDIDRWRVKGIEEANAPGSSLGERLGAAERVLAARPSPAQAEQCRRVQIEVQRALGKRLEEMRAVAALAEAGDYAAAEAEITRMKLNGAQPSAEMEKEARTLVARVRAVRQELDAAYAAGLAPLRDHADPGALQAALDAVEGVLVKRPKAGNRPALDAVRGALRVAVPAAAAATVEAETEALSGLLVGPTVLSGDLAAAVNGRVTRLHALISDAQSALDYARKLARENLLADALKAFDEIQRRGEWRRIAAASGLATEIAAVRERKLRQDAQLERFRATLAKGDHGAAYAMAREIGLKTLPLLIESRPSGAEVWRSGTRLGLTPLVLEFAAVDRGDLALELRLPGHLPLAMRGGDAIGGWRLMGWLQRQPAATASLAFTITNHPAAVDGRLWLASGAQIAAVAADGTVQRFATENSAVDVGRALSEPLYAPAGAADDGVLIATRDRLILRLGKRGVERLPVAERSDRAVAAYRSRLVLNRRWLVIAGLDGALHASDDRDQSARWDSPAGAPFAADPVAVGEHVLTLRSDGSLESWQGDNGTLVRRTRLAEPALTAWVTATGLAGYSGKTAWSWSGGSDIDVVALPREPVAGGPGVFTTLDRHVFVAAASSAVNEWLDLGQYQGRLSATPVRWRGHAVVPTGDTLQFLGPQAFTAKIGGVFLTPVELGDRLACATASGEVVIYGQ